jgi:alpha-L-fucosidase
MGKEDAMLRSRLGSGLLLGAAGALLTIVAANAASINVSPASIPAGGTVTVSGDVLAPGGQAGCQLPGTVLLFSGAFGDINTPVQASAGADAKFSVSTAVPAAVAPGTYTITGRCGGGNLGVQASLVVTAAGLPSTGSGGLLTANSAGQFTPWYLPAALLALTAASILALGWRSSMRAAGEVRSKLR